MSSNETRTDADRQAGEALAEYLELMDRVMNRDVPAEIETAVQEYRESSTPDERRNAASRLVMLAETDQALTSMGEMPGNEQARRACNKLWDARGNASEDKKRLGNLMTLLFGAMSAKAIASAWFEAAVKTGEGTDEVAIADLSQEFAQQCREMKESHSHLLNTYLTPTANDLSRNETLPPRGEVREGGRTRKGFAKCRYRPMEGRQAMEWLNAHKRAGRAHYNRLAQERREAQDGRAG